ncbi:putative E3 ubiquitin-protein ligase [Clavispora lusitaniae]|uniref:E3 ubiquitin-protein ligase n=1 Tax=Clavispora lusitaniae TaxID=36911 RepID=A0ACD0WKQ1_CLALS|nr:putative PHD type zinc finger protein with BAH domain-containing protein [Clavispora lusitaniae]KAF7580404.1 BAH domain family protein [Clavispora lusitaniae]QFZ27971.1 putative E3 ubiquitin-protein ligase [Clavispora lusitaniae]QFZ32722.1 putative E3 ubiquitin-protein ligase [Clavispora lusitaniae]QFZ38392.1 putative E3 ubiquitin-protein ligase [Clavispora lusitaniae]
MAQSRPKRKAACNKNYSDAIIESRFDDIVKPAQANPRNGSRRRGISASPSKSTGSPSAQKSTGKVPYNWQPPPSDADVFSRRLNLTDATVDTKKQVLSCPHQPFEASSFNILDEAEPLAALLSEHTGQKQPKPRRSPQTVFQLKKGDFIYMVSEPPGEPYYIGRIMGFKEKKKEEVDDDASKYLFQIQWFYRPRDISKQTSDSRLLFASMHSDTCPLASFRGLVTVKHKAEVEETYTPPKNMKDSSPAYSSALEYYCSFPNHFYFDKLFDRYMIKFYDIIKTSTLLQYIDNTTNNSRNFLLALNKRYEFIFMESSRTKQFLNNFNSTSSSHCHVCAEWCSSNESVVCAGCNKNFHMLCLDPPLLKKPSRGFSWSCAVCTKKHELEHRSRKTLMLSHDNKTTNEQELSEASAPPSPKEAEEPEAAEEKAHETILPKYELMAIEYLRNDASVSVEERRLREEWALRYLGKHARLEDAVDPDDRSPYPRACTNLGARFQASNIPEFEGHPLVYYDPERQERTNKTKKSSGSNKSKKKEEHEEKELEKLPVPKEFQNVPPRDFPQWLQPRPKGYIERGVDDGEGKTCTLMWKASEEDKADDFKKFDAYIDSCKPIAARLDILANSPNFMDAIVKFYMDSHGDTTKAFELSNTLTRESLKEPTFSKEEIKRFEDGVRKNGSELYPTYKEVKTQPCSMVVRFYYLWKKTNQGRLIWGNFSGRKKKPSKDEKTDMKVTSVVDEYADSDDDSSYESEKIVRKNKMFQCKHCESYQSQKWYKITGSDGVQNNQGKKNGNGGVISALCFRCAKLWRRYAVYWEDPQEIQKRNSRGIGGYRRKVEPELIADAEKIIQYGDKEGGLCYEIDKKSVSSSILPSPSITPKKEPLSVPQPVSRNGTNGKENQVKTPVAKSSPDASRKPTPKLTSRQLSLSTKQAIKEEPKEEPAPKKRKQNSSSSSKSKPKTEDKDKLQTPAVKKTKTAVPKATAIDEDQAEKVDSDTKKKRKSPPDGEKKAATLDNQRVSKPGSSGAKRQKKSTTEASDTVSPIFNAAYRADLPRVASVGKIDKRSFPVLDKSVLEEIVDNYKLRQLTDMKSLTLQNQTPSNAKVDQPFAVSERNCSVCMEVSANEESFQETLICTNCGVNIHASCGGITVFGKQKPIKHWICDPCTNDLSPNFSTSYSCSLCLANELNYEGSILGSSTVKPDYLVPILDSGKWCHLTCAIFAYKDIFFRNLAVAPFITKEVLHASNTRSCNTAIESVSNVFLENYTSSCGICESLSGALVACDMCDENRKFHVTCAQDTAGFGLGFKLCTKKTLKANTSTHIGNAVGKLEPVLICSQHENVKYFKMREYGRRTPTGEPRPLIQLFLEDIAKSVSTKSNGPQLKAHNYISMIEKFMDKEDVSPQKARKAPHAQELATDIACAKCKVGSSPSWWAVSGESSVHCQNCHFSDSNGEESQVPEGQSLRKELHEPLGGEIHGIKNSKDHIGAVHSTFEPKPSDILAHLDSILSRT